MTLFKRILSSALLVCSLSPLQSALAAPVVYALDYSTSTLLTVDIATGTSTVIGSNNLLRNGLAFGGDGTLYANNSGSFGTLDTNTGSATVINGATGRSLQAMDFNADFSKLYGLDFNNGGLYQINSSTGVSSFVANTGLTLPSSLAIRSDNRAFVADTFTSSLGLREINLVTGALGPTIAALTEGMTSMAFDGNDVLYGVGIGTDRLYRIDIASGVSTVVAQLAFGDVRGLAFRAPGVTNSVPEPTTLLLAGLGLLAAGCTARRRRG